MIKRYVLKVSYDGTDFSGWQIQPKGRTVQGVLEEAAESVFGVPTKVVGSGRTDAGVHAMGQICQFDADTTIPPKKLAECFNGKLPPDVRALASNEAKGDFDCTRHAKKKIYRYSFYTSDCELPLLSRYSAWVRVPLDSERMKREAERMVGEHDFKAFCASGSSAKTTVRTVYSVEIERKECYGGAQYFVTVCGNGFLYNMVRILVGHLVAVGCGQKEEGSVLAAFEKGERNLLGKTMPPMGLTMVGADYGVDLFGKGD